ncbi:MAG: M42 family metallopeptidase [Anaerolineales bacterium]
MDQLPPIDADYLFTFLTQLLNIPSPTGYTETALQFVEKAFQSNPNVTCTHNHKGALIAKISGKQGSAPRGLTAHVDTLGAMVKEIKSNGRLKLSKIGGFAWNTVEGEGCTIFASNGTVIRGSILLTKASAHVHGSEVNDLKREDDNIEVRLDIRSENAEQTRQFGIEVGDFVAFDPRVEINNGFIRSRHLDDKACVACIVSAIKSMHDAGLQALQDTTILISNYEEVGHGAASGLPTNLTELISVDMAAVGEGQTSDEFHASLCVKDSGGPYHHGLSQKLRRIADHYHIPFKVDIYPYYGSDGEAYWRAGGDVAVALIGPGVDASHNYERTHLEALIATTQWIMAYLISE